MTGAVSNNLPSGVPILKSDRPEGSFYLKINHLWLKLSLCLLVIIIIVLIIIITIPNAGESNEGNNLTMQRIENLGEQLRDKSDVTEIAEICQKSVENVDETTEAVLLTECARWIMSRDKEKRYSERVLDDLIRADEIWQSVNSAVNVMNAASFYDDIEVENRYYEILNERKAENNNQEVEVIG